MDSQILTLLIAQPGRSAPEIVKHLTENAADGVKILKQEVNQTLYRMSTKKLCTHTNDQPPRWSAVASTKLVTLVAPPTGCALCGCTGACREQKRAAVTPVDEPSAPNEPNGLSASQELEELDEPPPLEPLKKPAKRATRVAKKDTA